MSVLLDLLYPRRCSVCGALLPFGKTVCVCTKQRVQTVPEDACEHCGAAKDRCSCGEKTGHALRHLTAPFLYADLIRARLRSLKFQGDRRLAKPLGNQMALRFASRFPTAEIDVVTFVPMTKEAKRTRGFNQSALLAKTVAKRLLLPVEPLLEKTAATPHQSSLSAEERMKNLNGKFRVAPGAAVRGKTVLLCDDIKTTGSTLWECEKTLMAAGAADVFCLCCAVSDYTGGDAWF